MPQKSHKQCQCLGQDYVYRQEQDQAVSESLSDARTAKKTNPCRNTEWEPSRRFNLPSWSVGAMWKTGKPVVVKVYGTLNAKLYVRVLYDKLLPNMILNNMFQQAMGQILALFLFSVWNEIKVAADSAFHRIFA